VRRGGPDDGVDVARVEAGEPDAGLAGTVDGDHTVLGAAAHAAHNGLLMNMFDVLNTARALPIWGTLKRRTSSPERRRCEHTAIVDALRDRDPDEAAAAMRTHLQNVSDNLLGRH
jgi:DNA-binding GntR family transcriptional regulator